MTDTSQKLREALQRYGKHDRDCGVNNTRFNCACNCGLEAALALQTVPAISDTWGISRALVTLYAYECDGATDKALALITADHIPDYDLGSYQRKRQRRDE